jgi:transcriptional regulator with XRE-family HTH domain
MKRAASTRVLAMKTMLDENVNKQFGIALRNWRKKSGISQEELAWRSQLHRTYICDIERGARNPSLQSIQRLAKALNLSLSILFKPLGEPTQITPTTPVSGKCST